MQAVQEANEDLRDAYETKVKDLFEKQGIDRKSLNPKAIEPTDTI
jgi:predicted GNAT family acetyltransferase